MGVFDKIMDVMKVDSDEDDYYDDEFEAEEDDEPKRSFFKKKDKDDDYNLENNIVKETDKSIRASRNVSKKKNGSGMEVRVLKPTSFEESRDVTDTLLSNRTVVLNLEGLEVDIAQRIIDYTCGTCVALDGDLRKISNYIFIATPRNVDLSGDLQDIISGAFDIPSIQTDF